MLTEIRRSCKDKIFQVSMKPATDRMEDLSDGRAYLSDEMLENDCVLKKACSIYLKSFETPFHHRAVVIDATSSTFNARTLTCIPLSCPFIFYHSGPSSSQSP